MRCYTTSGCGWNLLTKSLKCKSNPSYRNKNDLNNIKYIIYSGGRNNVCGFSTKIKNGLSGHYEVIKSGEYHDIVKNKDFDLNPIEYELALKYSQEILSDPISDITELETNKCLIPYPKCDMPYWLGVLTEPFKRCYVYEPACVMIQLCIERLENENLTTAFGIGSGFNIRAYFLTLHIWILHRRALKEIPEGILLDRYLFNIYFDVLKNWLLLRKTPEYRFNKEFENCQGFMMKFLIDLDKSTFDQELYPYKIAEVIKRHMYEDDVNEEHLKILVKYTIRQFVHISNLTKKHFMDAMFLWADAEEFCKPTGLLKRMLPQVIKHGGIHANGNHHFTGYTPGSVDTRQLNSNDNKLIK